MKHRGTESTGFLWPEVEESSYIMLPSNKDRFELCSVSSVPLCFNPLVLHGDCATGLPALAEKLAKREPRN